MRFVRQLSGCLKILTARVKDKAPVELCFCLVGIRGASRTWKLWFPTSSMLARVLAVMLCKKAWITACTLNSQDSPLQKPFDTAIHFGCSKGAYSISPWRLLKKALKNDKGFLSSTPHAITTNVHQPKLHSGRVLNLHKFLQSESVSYTTTKLTTITINYYTNYNTNPKQ